MPWMLGLACVEEEADCGRMWGEILGKRMGGGGWCQVVTPLLLLGWEMWDWMGGSVVLVLCDR